MKITVRIEDAEFKRVKGLTTAYMKRIPDNQYAVVGYHYLFPDDLHDEVYYAIIEIFRKDDPRAGEYYRRIKNRRATRKAKEKEGKTERLKKPKKKKSVHGNR